MARQRTRRALFDAAVAYALRLHQGAGRNEAARAVSESTGVPRTSIRRYHDLLVAAASRAGVPARQLSYEAFAADDASLASRRGRANAPFGGLEEDFHLFTLLVRAQLSRAPQLTAAQSIERVGRALADAASPVRAYVREFCPRLAFVNPETGATVGARGVAPGPPIHRLKMKEGHLSRARKEAVDVAALPGPVRGRLADAFARLADAGLVAPGSSLEGLLSRPLTLKKVVHNFVEADTLRNKALTRRFLDDMHRLLWAEDTVFVDETSFFMNTARGYGWSASGDRSILNTTKDPQAATRVVAATRYPKAGETAVECVYALVLPPMPSRMAAIRADGKEAFAEALFVARHYEGWVQRGPDVDKGFVASVRRAMDWVDVTNMPVGDLLHLAAIKHPRPSTFAVMRKKVGAFLASDANWLRLHGKRSPFSGARPAPDALVANMAFHDSLLIEVADAHNRARPAADTGESPIFGHGRLPRDGRIPYGTGRFLGRRGLDDPNHASEQEAALAAVRQAFGGLTLRKVFGALFLADAAPDELARRNALAGRMASAESDLYSQRFARVYARNGRAALYDMQTARMLVRELWRLLQVEYTLSAGVAGAMQAAGVLFKAAHLYATIEDLHEDAHHDALAKLPPREWPAEVRQKLSGVSSGYEGDRYPDALVRAWDRVSRGAFWGRPVAARTVAQTGPLARHRLASHAKSIDYRISADKTRLESTAEFEPDTVYWDPAANRYRDVDVPFLEKLRDAGARVALYDSEPVVRDGERSYPSLQGLLGAPRRRTGAAARGGGPEVEAWRSEDRWYLQARPRVVLESELMGGAGLYLWQRVEKSRNVREFGAAMRIRTSTHRAAERNTSSASALIDKLTFREFVRSLPPSFVVRKTLVMDGASVHWVPPKEDELRWLGREGGAAHRGDLSLLASDLYARGAGSGSLGPIAHPAGADVKPALVYTPPYSPRLNPIENFFQALKGAVSIGASDAAYRMLRSNLSYLVLNVVQAMDPVKLRRHIACAGYSHERTRIRLPDVESASVMQNRRECNYKNPLWQTDESVPSGEFPPSNEHRLALLRPARPAGVFALAAGGRKAPAAIVASRARLGLS